MDVLVPDIGDFKDVPVIEILVKPGDKVEKESPLVTLESDKATLDVPSPAAGTVKEVKVKIGDKVSQGTLIVVLDAQEAQPAAEKPREAPEKPQAPEKPPAQEKPPAPAQAGATPRKEHGGPTETVPPPAPSIAPPAEEPASPATGGARRAEHEMADEHAFVQAHAGPGVRAMARELGVDLLRVKGSGPKSRILREDVQAFVKSVLSGAAGAPAAAGGLSVAPWPKVDFAKYGPIEAKPLTRIQKIAGPGLHRNWVSIPHVTSCEDADITELEAFRVALNKEQEVKVTLLAFLMKASVSALMKFPNFNSSLDGDHLVLKKYYNVGFAADTPQGLLVPVVKDADKKGVLEIARETAELALKARDGKLQPGEMQGATFTISSLGGIGGTYFTPIINAPEVAILGVCRAAMRPVWNGSEFKPRLMLPLSLSWDHRVVDGAAAGRFNAHLAAMLGDARRMLL